MSAGNERAGRGWLVWLMLPTILVSVLCAGGAVVLKRLSGAAPAVASPSPSPSPSPSQVAAVDDAKQKFDRLNARIGALLSDQAAALLRQDEAAFLRPAKDPAVRDKLLLRYRNLVALRISKMIMTIEFLSMDTVPGRWRADMVVSFCFVVADCVRDKISEPTVWAENPDGPELVSIEPARKPERGWFGDPQPWETTELVVAHGNRVLVAAPKSLASRLPAVLKAAEQAVPVADSFAIGTPPDLYRVYLADATAWKSWYGYVPPRWSAGYSNAIGATHSDVVLNNSHSRASFLPELLRHELTHASTLQGSHRWEGNWWLIEGIAEVAGETGAAVDSDLRRFIRGSWDRKLPADGPEPDASLTHANRIYGIAHLAVKCLETKFGRAKLLSFFERVIEFAATYDSASTAAFGLPWAGVEADCLAAIRAS